MPLKWLVQNKYKLMAFIIVAYVLADILQHKGLVRVLIPKNFPGYMIDTGFPGNKNALINTNKEWVKGVNSKARMEAVNENSAGLECDIYFDPGKNEFDVHHDKDNSSGLNLDDLLQVYQRRGLRASFWLDFKNLNDSNSKQSVTEILRLRNKFGLIDKLLVESYRVDLLKQFSDSGLYTSYYTPMFNPYLCSEDSLKHWTDYLKAVVDHSSVNALSGYYFQYPFLHHCFPNYPILIWSPNDKFSIVNWWYKKRIASNEAVFISLYP